MLDFGRGLIRGNDCQLLVVSSRIGPRGRWTIPQGALLLNSRRLAGRACINDNRACQATVAFVAAATAEISRPTLAYAMVLQGMRMLAEDGGLDSAEDCALLVLNSLAGDPPSSA